ncbi:unnamed protein product [Trichogramma brassicae]|uniref:Uncharacterized protein n=1 Tax=Trichogramma brassicae TaxID=86971 RepID=A0A6H5I9R1_9HYME|nr:unnamed protein product [Trichogramma brassicae]
MNLANVKTHRSTSSRSALCQCSSNSKNTRSKIAWIHLTRHQRRITRVCVGTHNLLVLKHTLNSHAHEERADDIVIVSAQCYNFYNCYDSGTRQDKPCKRRIPLMCFVLIGVVFSVPVKKQLSTEEKIAGLLELPSLLNFKISKVELITFISIMIKLLVYEMNLTIKNATLDNTNSQDVEKLQNAIDILNHAMKELKREKNRFKNTIMHKKRDTSTQNFQKNNFTTPSYRHSPYNKTKLEPIAISNESGELDHNLDQLYKDLELSGPDSDIDVGKLVSQVITGASSGFSAGASGESSAGLSNGPGGGYPPAAYGPPSTAQIALIEPPKKNQPAPATFNNSNKKRTSKRKSITAFRPQSPRPKPTPRPSLDDYDSAEAQNYGAYGVIILQTLLY